jgi:hypothetical protein
MLVCFFYMKFVPLKLPVNQVFYFKALEYSSSLMKKDPNIWPDKWILQHDNAPSHTPPSAQMF